MGQEVKRELPLCVCRVPLYAQQRSVLPSRSRHYCFIPRENSGMQTHAGVAGVESPAKSSWGNLLKISGRFRITFSLDSRSSSQLVVILICNLLCFFDRCICTRIDLFSYNFEFQSYSYLHSKCLILKFLFYTIENSYHIEQ